MDEQQWFAGDDPTPMLEFLRGRASDRKLRLFAVACCRRIWDLFDDERCREALVVAEAFADGRASGAGRLAVHADLNDESAVRTPAWHTSDHGRDGPAARAALAAYLTSGDLLNPASAAASAAAAVALVADDPRTMERRERTAQADLLRDVFGLHPFRPATLSPAWLTPDVRSLAQAAYDHRALPEGTLDLTRLALLADALEDAGCTEAEVLGHLRSPGLHVRGCWALDLVLGLE